MSIAFANSYMVPYPFLLIPLTRVSVKQGVGLGDVTATSH